MGISGALGQGHGPAMGQEEVLASAIAVTEQRNRGLGSGWRRRSGLFLQNGQDWRNEGGRNKVGQ